MAVGVEAPSANGQPLALKHHYAQGALTVELPGVASLDGIELDISGSELRLRIPCGATEANCPVSVIPFPAEVADAGPAAATFSRKRRQLVVSWPVTSSVGVVLDEPAPADVLPAVVAAPVTEPVPVATPTPQPVATPTLPQAAAGTSAPAYGSIWNANSWHWEEKNCMDSVSAEIRRALEACERARLRHVRELDGSGARLSEIGVKGEASIMLRRGKRFLTYELSVEFKWSARDEFGGCLGVKGTCEITGVTQEEDDIPTVAIKVSAGSGGKGVAAGKAVAGWLRQKGASYIAESLRGEAIGPPVMALEAAQADAAADAKRRQEEKAKADDAKQTRGSEQARIAEEQRRLEGMGRQAALQASGGGGAAAPCQASVWNPNAWHWEERPMTAWSRAWLARELEALHITLLGGTAEATLIDVEVSGDASVSIRKGRPIVLFQLAISCRWKATPGAEGMRMGESCGSLTVPDFSSEEGARGAAVELHVSSDHSGGRLPAVLRKDLPRAVRPLLARFAEALSEQLPRTAPAPAQA